MCVLADVVQVHVLVVERKPSRMNARPKNALTEEGTLDMKRTRRKGRASGTYEKGLMKQAHESSDIHL